MLPLLAGIAGLALLGNPFKAKRRSAKRKSRRNPPRDPRFAGSFKGDAPAGSYVDGDTAAVEGPRGWESWIFGAEIGPRGYREAWQFAAKHPSERAAVEHAKEMVWGPIKRNPGWGDQTGVEHEAFLAHLNKGASAQWFKAERKAISGGRRRRRKTAKKR